MALEGGVAQLVEHGFCEPGKPSSVSHLKTVPSMIKKQKLYLTYW